ncbi:ketosynthase chain-length factor [Amorphoplanes nipponensis]|uniref:Actinorhodin polyketide putative beta-ketoacyl synthase 2 n=1 Tax=Actinoplanes nipponensis TaxID=135950 RepID=A0A919JAG2_9ACTN|nr:ketosynthase chain-length factor [Actinoplanes nipponensis]GIE47369.1 actinorhodin polyketide putative beta-ketoacyl synthase 2 [Actinoplanes nipponensis]
MSAAVTGLGVLAPNGVGTGDYWRHTRAGTSGIRPITRFDASRYPIRLAGEVRDFDPAAHLPGRLVPQTDRMTQLALVATEWALADAGLAPDAAHDFDFGVVTSASAGGLEFGQRELQKLWTQGPSTVSAYMSFSWFYAVNTGQISIRHKLRGPAAALVTEQAGGLDAVGLSRRLVADGTPVVITAGVDGALCPMGVAGQVPAGQWSTCDDPARAYRPFDAGASGGVAGEGGAVLVIEDGAAARRRGARVYGEIAGYAATFDPPPGSDREPGLGRAAATALRQADLVPDEIDVVLADAAGTLAGDRAEADALEKLFGPRGVPVTAPKTMTGRLSAGAGTLDVATALLAMRDGIIPPTVNTGGDGYGHQIDLVTSLRHVPVRTALVLARGIGGFNAAVVLRAADRRSEGMEEA